MIQRTLNVLWDGIRNVAPGGHPLLEGSSGRSYACTQRWLGRAHGAPLTVVGLGSGVITSPQTAPETPPIDFPTIEFVPYEQLLSLAVPLRAGLEPVGAIVQVYGVDLRTDDRKSHLIYQETLSGDEIIVSINGATGVVAETAEEFSLRTAAYCGEEDFVNGMRPYTVSIAVRYVSAEASAGSSPVDRFEYQVRARDLLTELYNRERDSETARYLSDFARIQRLLRHKTKFFWRLQHVEEFMEQHPEASLLAALEHYEDLAHFPTTQAIPLGLLPGDVYNELVGCAYAINDVGVRSTHGGLTHRIQWHAIISLVTDSHSVPIAPGFYHSPLELYCIARGRLFDVEAPPQERCRVGDCAIDLWRFMFDRFDKHGAPEGYQTEVLLNYPEIAGDELHYAEQAHMAIMNLPADATVAVAAIGRFGAELVPGSAQTLTREDVWLERYLQGISHPDGGVTESRLTWGCLLTEDEWRLLNRHLDEVSDPLHGLRRLSLSVRSYFAEAVVAVRVITRIFDERRLVPAGHPLHTVLDHDYGATPRANILEDIAPRLRIARLSAKRNSRGEAMFKRMVSPRGIATDCLIPAKSPPITPDAIAHRRHASRMQLRPKRSIPTEYSGIPFP